MKQTACPKLWQVEALRDRELSGQLLVEARAHLANCAICRAEHADLASLQIRLKTCVPIDEIAVRRLRAKMLAKADEWQQGEPHKRRYGRLALAPLVFVSLLALAWLVSWRVHEPAARLQLQLQASTGALWTRTATPGIEYIDLADGLLSIAVDRRPSTARLIVRVPEGEIEDTGTRFRVWVSGGRTREIAVETGSVVYRRAHASPLVLESGSVWHSVEPPAAAVSATPAAASSITRSNDPATSAGAPPRPSVPSTGRKPPLPEAPTAAPSGATEEDLAYLHVVALLHEARDEEARLAARDYLRRYPDGFRRVEVSELLERSGAKP